jgi:hypothetical protein
MENNITITKRNIPPLEKEQGFNHNSEKLNSRVAMISFVLIFIFEAITRQTLFYFL